MKGKRGCGCGMSVADDGKVIMPSEACERHVDAGLPDCECPEPVTDPLALIVESLNEDGTWKEETYSAYKRDKYGREHQAGCASIDTSIEPMLNAEGKQIGWQSIETKEDRLAWLQRVIDYLASLDTFRFELAIKQPIVANVRAMITKERMSSESS